MSSSSTNLSGNYKCAIEALLKPLGSECLRGIQLYKQLLSAVASESDGALLQSLCVPCGPFLHLPLAPTAQLRYLNNAHMLVQFGRFFLRVFMSTVSH